MNQSSKVEKQGAAVRAVAAGLVVLSLSSCGGGSGSVSPGAGTMVTGRVMGGQQPVAGATVDIYLAGTSSGYQEGATSLLSVTTDSNGQFTFSASAISCPSTTTPVPVYFVATGGNAGDGTNAALVLSAVDPSCTDLQSSSFFVNIDEVTTVASVWALSQFLDSTGTQLGAPSTNVLGLYNAARTVANLADITTGLAATTLVPGATSGIPPASTVNTLANILASCVNSSGPGSSQCVSLFSNTTPPGSTTAPTTTLAAAWSMARYPGNQVANLWTLSTADAPFQTPAPLSAAPSDWALPIQFTSTTLNPVSALAVDGSGNVWIANSDPDVLSELSNNGVPVSGSPFSGGGLATIHQILIGQSGNVAVVSSSGSAYSLAVFDATTGEPVTGSPFSTGATLGAAAADTSGNIWAISSATSLAEFSPSGSSYTASSQPVAASGPTTVGQTPLAIAIDTSSNIWLSYYTQGIVAAQNAAGTALPGSGYTVGGNPGLILPASDGSIWVQNDGNTQVFHIVPGAEGATVSTFSYSAPYNPIESALDGGGNLWIVGNNVFLTSLTELSSSGAVVPGSPVLNNQLGLPSAMAIDASGNLWIGGDTGNPGTIPLVEVVGAAVPVKTPVIGAPALP
jgi:ligand-binding sensor domain-containing protein